MMADALRWNMNAGWNEVVALSIPIFYNKIWIIFHNKSNPLRNG